MIKAPDRPRVVSGRVVRTRAGGLSVLVQGRTVAVTAALLVALVAVMGVTLTTGDFDLSVGEVLAALTGDGGGAADFVVNTLRMPRLVTALCVGAALAVSGAILQSITGNPWAAPTSSASPTAPPSAPCSSSSSCTAAWRRSRSAR